MKKHIIVGFTLAACAIVCVVVLASTSENPSLTAQADSRPNDGPQPCGSGYFCEGINVGGPNPNLTPALAQGVCAGLCGPGSNSANVASYQMRDCRAATPWADVCCMCRGGDGDGDGDVGIYDPGPPGDPGPPNVGNPCGQCIHMQCSQGYACFASIDDEHGYAGCLPLKVGQAQAGLVQCTQPVPGGGNNGCLSCSEMYCIANCQQCLGGGYGCNKCVEDKEGCGRCEIECAQDSIFYQQCVAQGKNNSNPSCLPCLQDLCTDHSASNAWNFCAFQCSSSGGDHGSPPEPNRTCGNGVCEEGEEPRCPRCDVKNGIYDDCLPCSFDDPPCMLSCSEGTCPQDCIGGSGSSTGPDPKAQYEAAKQARQDAYDNYKDVKSDSYDAYKEQRTAAQQQYQQARDEARRIYDQMRSDARDAYDQARQQARDQYDAVRGAAWDAYQQSKREYEDAKQAYY